MSEGAMGSAAIATELEPIEVDHKGSVVAIRIFSLELNGVTVELSSLGASITKFLVPSKTCDTNDDDIVLGFQSPADMLRSGNPAFFGVIVGRVANRISNGRLLFLKDTSEPIQLEVNNDPNHLHGGSAGFSSRIWDASIVDTENGTKAVEFALLSEDGDQGYPGAVLVKATYSLESALTHSGVRLCLTMSAKLGDKPTPVNLAQHSYFNLAGHDNPAGVLDHTLTMPCEAYTPLDPTSIPTRQVCALSECPLMDWRTSRSLSDFLLDYGMARAGLSRSEAETAVHRKSRVKPTLALSSVDSAPPMAPYGLDHNYVVAPSSEDSHPGGLNLVGTLRHKQSQRRLTIWTNAPGVQVYTANYLDGTSPPPGICKNSASYGQWQGICLETQHFPDSLLVDETKHPEFFAGKCVILRPEEPNYRHCVEYELFYGDNPTRHRPVGQESPDDPEFHGSDSKGRKYHSAHEMWQAQGVVGDGGGRTNNSSDWYHRAAEYYEDNCAATIDGVLGGFANISELDLDGSRDFLKELQELRPSLRWSDGAACECGAGIGRVSKGLLLELGVTRCDLVESSARLLSAAPDYIGGAGASRCRFFCQGLQDWTPVANTYSMIWIQWVFCYLTDDDAVAFLRRCGDSLIEGGVICLKENTCSEEDFVVDVDDASVTRSVPYLIRLSERAGLRVVLQRLQDNFPDEIFPVPIIALEVNK